MFKKQFFIAAFMLGLNFSLLAQIFDLPSDIDGVSTGSYGQVQKGFSAREYVMHQNEVETNQYRAYNRSNSSIDTLRPSSMSLIPKPDSGQTDIPWQAELQTAAVLFSGIEFNN
ncbi:MAG: hypothetical protein QMC70_07230 [Bacteroidia bacterium]